MISKKHITKKIVCALGDAEEKILPLLKGRIFHVTSYKSYASIMKTGFIKHNKNNDFELTFGQSENSYGRSKAYVCLFDLKTPTDEQFNEYKNNFDFLTLHAQVNKANVYFILSPKIYNNIITNEVAYEEINKSKIRKVIIPFLECFYPINIDINDIEQIIIVKYLIPKSMPKSIQEIALELLHKKYSKKLA